MSTALNFADTCNNDGTASISGNCSEVGSTVQKLDVAFASGTVDQLVPAAFTTAGLLGILLTCNVDATIETNSGGSPADTISLKADRPFVWRKTDGYFSNKFGTNVTAFYLTGTNAGRLKGYILT
jgi:hypothetical protein